MLTFAYRDNWENLGLRLFGKREEPRPAAAPRPRVAAVAAARPELVCSRRDDAAGCTLRIEGALDAQTAPEVRALFDAVASTEKRVTLELDGLAALDSSGVGAIVSLFKRIRAEGGVLAVAGVRGQPLEVCKLLKLDRVFGL